MTHWGGAGQEGPKLWSEAWKRTPKTESVGNGRYQWKSEIGWKWKISNFTWRAGSYLDKVTGKKMLREESFKVGLSCQNTRGKRAWRLLALYLDRCYRFQELPPLLQSVEHFLNSSYFISKKSKVVFQSMNILINSWSTLACWWY